MTTLHDFLNALTAEDVPVLEMFEAALDLDTHGNPVTRIGTTSAVIRLVQGNGRRLALRLPLEERTASEWSRQYRDLSQTTFGTLEDRLAGGWSVVPEGLRIPDADLTCTALVSNWIDGLTLVQAAARAATGDNPGILRALAESVRELLNELRNGGFAHGDLTAQNIIVGTRGVMRVVDLDAATWSGRRASVSSVGSAGYRPGEADIAQKDRDCYAALVLHASLMALAEFPEMRGMLMDQYTDPHALLLLSEWDLTHTDDSELFRNIMNNGSKQLMQLFRALQRIDHDGPDSIARHIMIFSDLPAFSDAPRSPQRQTAYLREAVERVRGARDVQSQHEAELGVPDWPRPSPAESPPLDDVARLRDELRRALANRNEPEVARLWSQLMYDPAANLLRQQVLDLYASAYAKRIETAARQGNDTYVLTLAEEARAQDVLLSAASRKLVRAARERLDVRALLEGALQRGDSESLAELGVSGKLVVLGDTDRQSLTRVLQSLEMPNLARAIESDDDQIILNAVDEELFQDLPSVVQERIARARERRTWLGSVRSALRDRDAAQITELFAREPAAASKHLSAVERSRAERMISEHRVRSSLDRAIRANDENEIVGVLTEVEQLGMSLGPGFPWAELSSLITRVSVIEDIMAATDAGDYFALAKLIPEARELGLEDDPRLRGSYDLDVLGARLLRLAHLRRLRTAISANDHSRIVNIAYPDVFEVLDELSPEERDRVALAVRTQRQHDRRTVAARFEGE